MELADKVFNSRFHKAWWLMHVDVLFEDAIQEGGEDVQLVNWPVEMHRNGDESSNGFLADNGCEGVQKINTVFLFEATGD
jgi:hypothetical protein